MRKMLLILTLALLHCCSAAAVELDSVCDAYLIKSFDDCRKRLTERVDSSYIRTLMQVYEYNNDSYRSGLANVVMGAVKLHYSEINDAVGCMLCAEEKLHDLPELQPTVYYYMAELMSFSDTNTALHYAKLSLKLTKERDILCYNYCQIGLLVGREQGKVWFRKAFESSACASDEEYCQAMYALKYHEKMPVDKIVTSLSTFYRHNGGLQIAQLLAKTYLKNNNPDSAIRYINELKGVEYYKEEYLTLMAEYELLRGDKKLAEYYQNEAIMMLLRQKHTYIGGNILGNYYAQRSFRQQIAIQNAELRNYRLFAIVVVCLIVALLLVFVTIMLVRRHKKQVERINREGSMRIRQIEEAHKEKENTVRQISFRLVVDNYPKDVKGDDLIKDALRILSPLSSLSPEMNETGLTMTWMMCLRMSNDYICSVLHITKGYFYQKRLKLVEVFGFQDTTDMKERIIDVVAKYIDR